MNEEEAERLRSVALRNAESILQARNRAERELVATKVALESKSEELARSLEALQDETRILELLNRTGAQLSSDLNPQTVLQTVTDAATELSGASFGAFFHNSVTEAGEALLLYTLAGARREDFEAFGAPRNTPIFGPTFRGERVVRSDDITQDASYGQMEPLHGMPPGHLPVRSYLAVPVVSRSGAVLGGLFFGHPEAGVFSERTERVIVGLAAQAAIAVDNARLFEAAENAAQERTALLEAERAARSQAERASRMKDEFLATLSHELRTPLSSILGWSQLLRQGEVSPEEMEQGLEVIERNARVQTQLIDDLLDMSRIISGKLRLDLQQVDVLEVIEAAIESVRHAAEAKQIRLSVVLDPQAGPIRGDPGRLQQCCWNLLSNAIKFTPKGGKVGVSLGRVNSHLEIQVSDNGEGIAPEFLPHIFERFRQADSSTTRAFSGLGLGLSIVKHLVELHGGTIRATSAGVGRGASFCIELPVIVIAFTPAPAPRRHPRDLNVGVPHFAHPSLRGIRVLVVDDDADARLLLQRILTDCGAEVLLAASAEEGMGIVEREPLDMIVSDIGMSGEDGYSFIRRVRKLTPDERGRTPAAALTAFARAEDRTRALRAGFQIHVVKPVEPTEITAVIASLARRPQHG